MSLSFSDLLGIILPIFLIIGLGVLCRRGGLLTKEADTSLLKLTVNVLLPCLALHVILGNKSLLEPRNVLLPPLFGFVSILLAIGLAWLASRFLGIGLPARRAFSFCTGIQNYGYVPLPICLVLFGKDTAAVLFGFSMGVELAFWLVGVTVLTGTNFSKAWRRIFTPPVLAILMGLILNFMNPDAWLPGWAGETFTMLGSAAVPLALLLTGAMFADFSNPFKFLEKKRIILTSLFLRVFLMPILMLCFAKWVWMSPELRIVLMVQAAMPAAVAPVAITRYFSGDIETASRVVLGNTLFGLVSIPFWLQFGSRFLEIFP